MTRLDVEVEVVAGHAPQDPLLPPQAGIGSAQADWPRCLVETLFPKLRLHVNETDTQLSKESIALMS